MFLAILGTLLAVCAGCLFFMPFRKAKVDLSGKHVLITGGSTGIGKALAEQYLQRHARVSLVARSQSKLDAAQQALSESLHRSRSAGQVATFSADVTDIKQVQRVVSEAEAAHGPVYILICSAGSSTPGKFLEQDVSVYSDTMSLNYMGTVNALKAALPGMVQRGAGHVIVISSVMAVIGFTGYTSYAPSKWAVRGLCDCLRNELAGSGVGSSIAYPPDTETPGFEIEKNLMPEDGRQIQDIAGATLFKPKQVAQCIVSGVERGHYHIRGPDLGLNLLVAGMAGYSPRVYTWVVELLLAPIMVIFSKLAVFAADRIVRKNRTRSKQ